MNADHLMRCQNCLNCIKVTDGKFYCDETATPICEIEDCPEENE